MSVPLLAVNGLSKQYRVGKTRVPALRVVQTRNGPFATGGTSATDAARRIVSVSANGIAGEGPLAVLGAHAAV